MGHHCIHRLVPDLDQARHSFFHRTLKPFRLETPGEFLGYRMAFLGFVQGTRTPLHALTMLHWDFSKAAFWG
jgi:hypothetical protein